MVITNGRAPRPLRRRKLVESPYLQFFWVVLLAVFGPAAALYLIYGPIVTSLDSTWNTQVAALLATVAGFIGHRRVTAYPGTRGYSYILPSFLAAYGLAAMVLLVGRFAYSGVILTASLLVATTAMFVLRAFAQRAAPMQFFIVPGSEAAIVAETPGVEWIRLDAPEVPHDRAAAIVADLTATHAPDWERMLAKAAIGGHTVYHTKQLRESLTGRVQIDHLSENSFGSLLPALGYRGIKRGIDVSASVVRLPPLALPMLAVGILIRLDSQGPALFRQQRMGYRGEPFTVVKFRSMHQLAAGLESDPVTRDSDDRVTRLGRFLRRTRFDELPQLWNVLKGEMSLIGPRPEVVELSDWYDRELPFYVYRHIVRPGITGWAQINQGHVAALDDVLVKLHYDFYYIKNFSAWMDILIAMRTVVIMLSGFGSK